METKPFGWDHFKALKKKKINKILRGKKNQVMEEVQAGSFVNKHY